MSSLSLFGTVFGVIFLAELPDKTALAALVLATRHRALPVFVGTGLALTVQSVVAVVLLEFTWPFATPLRNYLTTFASLGCLWLSAAAHQAIRSRQMPKAALSPRHDVRAA